MKEIVEKLLDTEKQANELINSANREASQITADTEQEIAKMRQHMMKTTTGCM